MTIEDFIDHWTYRIQNRITDVELQWFKRIGVTLKKLYDNTLSVDSLEYRELIASDLHQLQRLLNKAHTLNRKDIESMFREITDKAYSMGEEIADLKDTAISGKAAYRAMVTPLLRQTMRNYNAMSKSTTTDRVYRDTMRRMVNRMTIDPERINRHQAMRQAVTQLAQEGVNYVKFDNKKNAYTRRLDSSVRASLSGEMSQVVSAIQEKLGQEIDSDAIEISVETACAWDHLDCQGKIFTLENFEKLQAFEVAETIDGEKVQLGGSRQIGQYNCRHMTSNFLIGISEPSFSKEELEKINKKNKDGIVFDGRKLALYDATQLQRQLETEQRKHRGALEIIRQVGGNDPAFKQDKKELWATIQGLRKQYNRLGDTLAPHAIIRKPGRMYNINQRGFR